MIMSLGCWESALGWSWSAGKLRREGKTPADPSLWGSSFGRERWLFGNVEVVILRLLREVWWAKQRRSQGLAPCISQVAIAVGFLFQIERAGRARFEDRRLVCLQAQIPSIGAGGVYAGSYLGIWGLCWCTLFFCFLIWLATT